MLDRSKHEMKMRELLLEIYSNPELSRLLAFKGGTACYFFYNLPRFSTDLDFNILDPSQKEVAYQELVKVASKIGNVKDKFIKRNTIFLLVEHTSKLASIKIEVSTREIEKINKNSFLSFYGTTIRVVDQKYIFASKLYALTQRSSTTARDLYDIHFFFKNNWEIDENFIKTVTNLSLKEYLEKLPKFIEKNFNTRNITEGLNFLLSSQSQRDFVKKKLKSSVIQQIQMYLDSTF